MIFHVETSHLIYGANKMTIFIYFYLWRLQIYSSGPGNYPATQLTFTCSKSTIETLEKDVKYVQSLQ